MCFKEKKEVETMTSGDCARLIPWLAPEWRSVVDMVSDRYVFQRFVSTVAHKQIEKQILLMRKLELILFVPVSHEHTKLVELLIIKLCKFQKYR